MLDLCNCALAENHYHIVAARAGQMSKINSWKTARHEPRDSPFQSSTCRRQRHAAQEIQAITAAFLRLRDFLSLLVL